MLAALESTDWDTTVIDRYLLTDFFNQLGINTDDFNQTAYNEILFEIGVIDMPYEVNYIKWILEEVGIDSTVIDSNTLLDYLEQIDWEDFVLDQTAIEDFLGDFNIDINDYNVTAYYEMLEWLGVADIPYEVHYILDTLEYLQYDTSSLSQTEMQEYLLAVDWTNFVLDMTVMETFFTDFDIDMSQFNETRWEEVKLELEIWDLPYEVHYILGLLDYVGYEFVDDVDQQAMLD